MKQTAECLLLLLVPCNTSTAASIDDDQ
jgi:hypothetical protein